MRVCVCVCVERERSYYHDRRGLETALEHVTVQSRLVGARKRPAITTSERCRVWNREQVSSAYDFKFNRIEVHNLQYSRIMHSCILYLKMLSRPMKARLGLAMLVEVHEWGVGEGNGRFSFLGCWVLSVWSEPCRFLNRTLHCPGYSMCTYCVRRLCGCCVAAALHHASNLPILPSVCVVGKCTTKGRQTIVIVIVVITTTRGWATRC